jgi:hypothetical protein
MNYPTIQREPIYAALFALMSGTAGFLTTSRILKHWDDVSPGSQPALFMAQGQQIANTERGKPTRWTLEAKVYVYVRTDGNVVPSTVLNPILDAIEAALQGNAAENTQTLGGLVDYCRIDGAIETDEGTLGQQAVAIIPISILAS